MTREQLVKHVKPYWLEALSEAPPLDLTEDGLEQSVVEVAKILDQALRIHLECAIEGLSAALPHLTIEQQAWFTDRVLIGLRAVVFALDPLDEMTIELVVPEPEQVQ